VANPITPVNDTPIASPHVCTIYVKTTAIGNFTRPCTRQSLISGLWSSSQSNDYRRPR
jgi:hypothetical protein